MLNSKKSWNQSLCKVQWVIMNLKRQLKKMNTQCH